MRIEVLPGPDDVAKRAADLICTAAAGRAIIGLPTGRTPIDTYALIAPRVRAGTCDFSRATVYALDEFAAAPAFAAGTNAAFYREHLAFASAFHCPDAAASDPAAHVSAYAEDLRRAGGMSLCVLGVGTNGHIAFNEPGSAVDSVARVVNLTQESRAAHADAFGGIDRVPLQAMTLGIADLLASREILVLATGAHKAAAVRTAIEGPPSTEVPASWLQQHPRVTWLLDAPAAAGLDRQP